MWQAVAEGDIDKLTNSVVRQTDVGTRTLHYAHSSCSVSVGTDIAGRVWSLSDRFMTLARPGSIEAA